MTVEISYRLRSWDYARVAAANARRSTFSMLVGLASCLVGASFVVTNGPIGLAVVATGLALLSGAVVAPFAWGVTRRHRELMLGEVHLKAGQDALEMRTGDDALSQPWSTFRAVIETGGSFLFVYPTGATFLIPFRAFGEVGLREFRTLIDDADLAAVDTRRALRMVTVVVGAAIISAALVGPKFVR